MTGATRVFSPRLYPRPAMEEAARTFSAVCPVELVDDIAGTRVTLQLPEGADEDLLAEFGNLALASAIELYLQGGHLR